VTDTGSAANVKANRDARFEWVVVVGLAAFAFVNALCWAHAVALGDAPDEPGHFEVVAFEYIFRTIPEFGVDDYGTAGRIALDGFRTPINTYSAQPGLSYIASVVAMDLFCNESQDCARVARYPGALWAALLTCFVFWGARAMVPGERGVAILAATVATCWPQLGFVFGYINNDGLTAVVCAGLVAAWFTGRNEGWRDRDAAVLGLFAGLVLLNKPNGFPLVGVAGLVLLWTLDGPVSRRARAVAITAGTAIAISGWWYAIAYSRYGWDLFASGRAEELRRQIGVEWSSGRFYGMSLLETAFGDFPRFGETWIGGTLRSSMGVFGPLTIGLPDWAYRIGAGLTVVAAVGLVVAVARSVKLRKGLDLVFVVSLLLVPALLALSLLRSWSFDYQAQGRYLFPAMLPYTAFLAIGLLGPFGRRARGVAGFAIMLLMFWIEADAFVVRLLGAYRRTFADFFVSDGCLASLWAGTMVVAVGASTLYWVRMTELAGGKKETPADGQLGAE